MGAWIPGRCPGLIFGHAFSVPIRHRTGQAGRQRRCMLDSVTLPHALLSTR